MLINNKILLGMKWAEGEEIVEFYNEASSLMWGPKAIALTPDGFDSLCGLTASAIDQLIRLKGEMNGI